MNIWEVVKTTCPYWYQLCALISACTSVYDYVITNSQTNMDASVFMTRRRKLKREEIFDDKKKALDTEPGSNTVPVVVRSSGHCYSKFITNINDIEYNSSLLVCFPSCLKISFCLCS